MRVRTGSAGPADELRAGRKMASTLNSSLKQKFILTLSFKCKKKDVQKSIGSRFLTWKPPLTKIQSHRQ